MSRTRISSGDAGPDAEGQGADILLIDDWVPYQFSYVSNQVSLYLESFYSTRFGLSVTGWRVMAILGMHAPLSAKELAEHTAMDQVQVTRAINQLSRIGMVSRRVDPADRRKVSLRLSRHGKEVYDQIVPHARSIERELLSVLTEEERACMLASVRKVVARARRIFESPAADRDREEAPSHA
ncbi:MarR family winged helix-turn-helix transcriptional regulator [Arenibaculum sp.]|uniref:MarR family winged helix-turn-helix transcriptional regulator n=1 Tax=Arenibaculum sp. TaxID=2865862 RepID=UPI002E143338|nr:MarR family winged helix-turn-helix transcriptional regulator [Arenibaculum sp.]